MKRELGSVVATHVTVVGGEHDGAVGRVLDYTDVGNRRIHLVQLSDGTILEVAQALAGEDGMPREIGS